MTIFPYIFTVRNEVSKVMFLHLSVILSTGRGLPQCMLGYHPPGANPPKSRHPPPGPGNPPGADPPGQTPPRDQALPSPEQTPPEQTPPQGDDCRCGRYASYWNAFLLNRKWFISSWMCTIVCSLLSYSLFWNSFQISWWILSVQRMSIPLK